MKGDHHDRGRIQSRQPVDRRTDGERSLGLELGRIVVRRSRTVATAVVLRQPPPAPIEVDQDLADGGTGLGKCRRDGRP